MLGMSAVRPFESKLNRIGVSKLSLVGALITITTSANAVMPLIAQQELSERLGSSHNYQLFLEAVTLVSIPFLLTAPLLLQGCLNKRVCQVGLIIIGLLNFILYTTDLNWHPLLLRCFIGIGYGVTIPMGQFILSEAKLKEDDRVTQFTMMLNLVAAGLCIVPFIAISLLWMGDGDSKYIFLFLSIAAWIVAAGSERLISNQLKIHQFNIASLKLNTRQGRTAAGDMLTIITSRSIYAMVLIWLSEIISNYDTLQVVCLFFTVPFVGWGFIAIPWVKRLKTTQSFAIFLLLPILALSIGLASGLSIVLPILLVIVALLSIPEAFTPGQLVSQWPTASGRQFGNLLTMTLMTVCLSTGPMVLGWVSWLAQNIPIQAVPTEMQRSVWLLVIAGPVFLIPLRLLWTKHVALELKQ